MESALVRLLASGRPVRKGVVMLPRVANYKTTAGHVTATLIQKLTNIPMAFSDIELREFQPPPALAGFVESFWMLVNHANAAQPMVLIPDGRIDVFFTNAAPEGYQVTLRGLDTQPSAQVIPPPLA